MLVEMINDDFVHQPVHRAAHCCDEVKNIGAGRFLSQAAFHGRDLPSDALYAGEEVGVVSGEVRHKIPP